ncbi:MAG: Na+/H+ antiporter NhaA, partial [Phycisphaerales bacterium]|nr:Na+/H+ antiporter NhaA [Phycisphaerales bacterium]
LWINDGLMAIFFLLVGLEIKRELCGGELSSVRKALLPAAGAFGGMAGPALIFLAFNWGEPSARAWGVPMATDIAFALGVLALLGSRVPVGLKVFLTALAIVDDLGAVAVIAVFYTDSVKMAWLGTAGGVTALLIVLNRVGVRRLLFYMVPGVVLWLAVLKSGVHATVAGVVLAMCIPNSARLVRSALPEVMSDILRRHDTGEGSPADLDASAIHTLEARCKDVQSPLLRLEHALLPWVSFAIMPIFALANAGVDLRAMTVSDLVDPVAIGIMVGLFAGNQIGILSMSWIVVKAGLGSLPAGVTWRQLHGASVLAGIGFTMSFFIAGLAFRDPSDAEVAKLGILGGSLVAGVVGLLLTKMACRST